MGLPVENIREEISVYAISNAGITVPNMYGSRIRDGKPVPD